MSQHRNTAKRVKTGNIAEDDAAPGAEAYRHAPGARHAPVDAPYPRPDDGTVDGQPPNACQAAQYVLDFIKPCHDVALAAQLPTLAFLLAMARDEARNVVNGHT